MRAGARGLAVAFVVVVCTAAAIGPAAAQSPSFGIDVPLTDVQGADGSVIELASVTVPTELVGQTCTASFESENNGSVREGSDLILSSGTSSLELENVEASTPLVLERSGPLTLGSTLAVSVRLGPEGQFSGGAAASTVTCTPPPTTTTTTTTTTTPPPPPDVCQFTVSPLRLPPTGGTVTVAGTAPNGSVVRIFVGGVFHVAARASDADGAFSATFLLRRTSEIGVGVDDHPATRCGLDVVRQAALPGGTGTSGTGTGGTGLSAGLPATGGWFTWAALIVGIALVVVGGALVRAVRADEEGIDS